MGKTDWRVYQFGNGAAEGDASMSDLLGGKGANLAEMSRLGLPVPPGFTLPTDICHYFNQNDGQLPDALRAKLSAALKEMGAPLGVAFGDAVAPLARVGAFGLARLNARYDGHSAEPWP